MAIAVEEGNGDIASFLVHAGADPNTRSESDWTALFGAIAADRDYVVGKLLEAGADPNQRFGEEAALHQAVGAPVDMRPEECAAEMVRVLLDAGADANARDGAGVTPLHHAAHQGRVDCLKLLLAAGADPEMADNAGRRPADEAAHGPAHDEISGLLAQAARIRAGSPDPGM